MDGAELWGEEDGYQRMNEKRIKLLQSMAIFGGVAAQVLDYLLRNCRLVTVNQGGYFFKEGDLADSMFVLEKGRVIVYRQWNEAVYKLRELQENDCFGEMALLDCKPRSASVFATHECVAIEITAAQLSQLYHQFTEQFILIYMNMAREVCRRLRDADQRLFEITAVTNVLSNK